MGWFLFSFGGVVSRNVIKSFCCCASSVFNSPSGISDNPLLVYLGVLLSPGYPVHRVFSVTRGFATSRAELFEEELRVNVPRDVPELEVPAFLFQGRDDWQVSTPSALRYFDALKAPVKGVVIFDGGHMVAMLQSEAFLKALVEKVRPNAITTSR